MHRYIVTTLYFALLLSCEFDLQAEGTPEINLVWGDGATAQLPAGVYWFRGAFGEETRIARAVVVK